jgi:hypothetical protein
MSKKGNCPFTDEKIVNREGKYDEFAPFSTVE